MIGIDICSISRFSNMKNLDKFLEKYFTIREIEYISNTGYRDETIAGIFSLKEAFVKAIGTGFGTILPIDVEVIHNFSGKPELNVFNTIESKIDEISCSVSHDGDFATVSYTHLSLFNIQTPQAFRKNIILDGYKKFFSENFFVTDDSSIVENLGIKVKLVEGEYSNIKITTMEDVFYARELLERGI